MAHVVVIGAGIGGMPAAYEMKEALNKLPGKGHEVTVVSNVDYFHFVPSNPWVAVGWRTKEDISFQVGPYLNKKGINFVASGVKEIHAKDNKITLHNGHDLEYDYLLITTGPRLAFELVEGLGPDGHTHSVCHVDHAVEAYHAFEEFCKNPGPIVVGAVQGASCFGPAYEFAMILDTELRRRKIRDKVPMTFVTAEPYIGHLGLGGVGDSKGMLESEMRNRHIKWMTNAKTTKIEDGLMHVETVNSKGETEDTHEVPFKYSMMLPPFRGIPAVAQVEEMCNPMGFVMINDFQQNPTYNKIYSAGVCVAIPPVEATPVPCGTPKTGYLIESMVTAAIHNICHDIQGESPEKCGTWNAICLADMGDTGAAFVALPQIPPRNVQWMKKGKWVHTAKVMFEKYFMRKMKTGVSEPFYEKAFLKTLGIKRLDGE
ncbi:sulfide:quinone oxidoreductase [Mariprofundus micogutta]|uniref:Sulfide-quinone reductase n=1 Tax=Mariprofundus micogutta TaxID=1921010 RepID=A0A1L8CP93_9PROT|nr:FAD/NAD(P)-binding oxidoreductase [Mariprofundus micogutta]GAV20740.1 sulfide:quinone oxidoreductase [Mariprofundus micogutta]